MSSAPGTDSPPPHPPTSPAAAPAEAARPVIAIVMNAHTPYRAHLHRRLVREIPGATFYSLFTHELSNSPWRYDPPAETNPVLFGAGEHSDAQARPRRAWHEWRKAGRIIGWLREHRAAAVIVGGYNDAGRV